MRLLGKLIEKGIEPFTQCIPISGQTMQGQHLLALEAPQLLKWIEPGRIGWQPDRLNLRQSGQRAHHVLMRVDRPIVLQHTDPLCLRIDAHQLAVEGDQFRAPDDLGIQIIDATTQRIECTNHAPLLVI